MEGTGGEYIYVCARAKLIRANAIRREELRETLGANEISPGEAMTRKRRDVPTTAAAAAPSLLPPCLLREFAARQSHPIVALCKVREQLATLHVERERYIYTYMTCHI